MHQFCKLVSLRRLSQRFKYLAVVVATFFSSHVLAQSFYVVEANGQLNRITLKGSNFTKQIIENECSNSVGSIATYKNDLYYFGATGLVKATIAGNKLINCKYLGSYNISFINALTVDKNGILYVAGGDQLYKIDPVTGTLTRIGTMPYRSAGDLLFYKDELYLASSNGILKVNLVDPSQSVVVISDAGNAYGLASVPYSSTENKVYALRDQDIIMELDLENNVVVRAISNTGFVAFDAASVVEDGSLAKVQIDSIRRYADCPFTGKGTIEVISYNALIDYTYELNGITNTTGVFTGLNPGTFHIKVKSNLEMKDTVITVQGFLLEKPTVSITTVDKLCEGPGQIILRSATPNNSLYTIQYNNLSYGINQTFSNLKAGTHRFLVLNKAGCAVDTINVVLNKCEIEPDGADVQQDCNSMFKGSVRIKTKPHTAVYTYKMGNTTNQSGIFNDLDKGTHKVTITSADDIKEMDVIVPDYEALAPVISYKTTNAICETTGSVKFNIVGDATGYTIKLDEKVYPFLHEFKLDAGTHSFTVIKPNGCLLNLYSVTLTAEGCEDLFFPNTFTPNNDGINDFFLPSQDGKGVNFKWKIFTRYGTPIFNSENSHNGWNGEYNGQPANTGVYYWVATYLSKVGKSVIKSGSVTLLR
jgi:gliding motility-associated-like protein